MQAHQKTLETFYTAFAALDADAMAGCYADAAEFQDEVSDFWPWSRQALGAPGLLLGWTPLLRAKVQRQAGANLRKDLASQP
jgi:hypothetical protein